jgi:hypothetical protein
MTLVGVPDGGPDAQRAQDAYPADAEQDFLLEAVFTVGGLKTAR